MSEHQIAFQPIGRRGPCPAGESLLDCAHRLGVELTGLCGGIGKCSGCRIRVLEGRMSALTPVEQEIFTQGDLESGWRLACQAYPKSNCRVDVPPECLSAQQWFQIEGAETDVLLDPPVKAVPCKLEPPSLTRPVADAENLIEAIGTFAVKHLDIEVVRDLSPRLREWNWRLTAHIRDRELIAISPVVYRAMGLAIDLGSTKIAGYLIDLENGNRLASRGIINPQIRYGEDIITRIHFAIRSSEGRNLLAQLVRDALMALAQDLCAEVGVQTGDILESVIVGNTAMHHLLLGLPVRQLARSPFVPAVRGDLNVKAREINLKFAPGAYVYFPPNIAGFVGADHVAALTATAGQWAKGKVVVLDIGTNTEISLIANGEILSVSCASGPAFEGYHIKHGVRASSGAIEKVHVRKEGIRYQTIGHAPPVGICGTGILDTIAQLYLTGVLNRSGRIQKGSHPRVVEKDGRLEFVLVPRNERERGPEISITQRDVREIQLSKAAIQAAIKILLEQANISETEIDKIIIAGAFGSYLNIANAVAVGMLPALPLDRFHQVGNAAGMGARLFLLSSTKREEVGALLARTKYLELGSMPQFGKTFAEACSLGSYHFRPSSEKRPIRPTMS